jgi:hypothetical protein
MLVAGAGHAPHTSHPSLVIGAIAEFVARVKTLEQVSAPATMTTPMSPAL